MKRYLFITSFLFLFTNAFSQLQITTKVRTFDFRLNIPYSNTPTYGGIADRVIAGACIPYYKIGNTEHIISVPLDTTAAPPIHFVRQNGVWTYQGYYPNSGIMGLAAVAKLDSSGSWALASTGDEGFTSLGDLHVVKTSGTTLNFQKISTYKDYFGDVAAGDINNDGLIDVVSYGGRYPNNLMQPFIQSANGTFVVDSTLIPGRQWQTAPTDIEFAIANGGYSVVVDKIFDSTSAYPVLVKGQYSTSASARFGIAFFSHSTITNRYDSISVISQLGAQQDTMIGLKIMRVGDLNRDGFKDIIAHFETPSGSINGIQIYLNNQNRNFTAGQSFYFYSNNRDTRLNYSDIVIYDINKDGYNDFLLSPWAGGIMNNAPNFYILNGNIPGQVPQGFFLKNCIYINDGTGNFNRISSDVSIYGHIPYFLRVLPSGNQLRYVGFTFPTLDGNPLMTARDSIRLIDVTVNFCNELVRPRFNTSNYTFCHGDTLTLSISNVNAGDSIKWYYGGNTDFSNVHTKRFTDTSTLFVTRTDSMGCIISSDTIRLRKHPLVNSRFAVNNLSQCHTGNNFSFTNTSTVASGTLTSHVWSFGDGGTAATLNTTRTYNTTGTYVVKLVSTSNNGCKDSTTQQVVVNPMPSTAYSINTAAQCLTDNSFTFTNSSTIASGTLTSHLWTFGDGGTATTLNTTKTYGSAGTYNVKLVSTSNNGCKDSITRQVTVHPMPIAGFTVSPAIQCLTGNSFSFANISTVSGGTTTSNWNFGNGSTSSNQNPINSYPNVGSYTVKLVSTSNNGCKDSTTRGVRIDVSPIATLNVAPYRSIHPGLLTTINASIAPAGIYKYTWYRNNQLISNETTTAVDSIGYRLWSGAYKMVIENLPPQLPCSYTTPELVIGDSLSSKLFIYPNPSNGQFRVTYYSPINTRYQVVVMDTKGAVLYRKPHEVTNRYQLIDINLQGASSGLYILQIQDPTGKQLASGQLVIQ
jgi:PKD repeat protein